MGRGAANEERDRELVEAMARGGAEALGELYDRHGGWMLRLARRGMGVGAPAEDLLHDLWLEVWRAADAYDPRRGTVQAWLRVRLRCRLLDRARRRNRIHAAAWLADHGGDRGQQASALIGSLDARRIAPALQSLSVEQRAVIRARYFGERTAKETARLLGIPDGTVKSRTAAALDHMRGSLLCPSG